MTDNDIFKLGNSNIYSLAFDRADTLNTINETLAVLRSTVSYVTLRCGKSNGTAIDISETKHTFTSLAVRWGRRQCNLPV